MKQLRGLTEEKIYPPKVEFEVYYRHQLHHAMPCRLEVQGAICSDSTAAYFSIKLPSIPLFQDHHHPTGNRSWEHQASLELDIYLSQLTDEEKDKQVSENILVKVCRYIKEWWMTGRSLGLDEFDISQINHDYFHFGGVRECAYQSLLKWRNESLERQKTTVKTLIEALHESGEYVAIEKIIKFLHEKYSA